MDILTNLLLGFGIAFKPLYLLYALVGAIFGTITGILPGLGPIGAMSILLSFTLYLDATGAMILFSGIYYGAMYGGSSTSILLNIPGEAACVVTCIDGYQMALKGQGRAPRWRVSAVGFFHRRDPQHRRLDLGPRPGRSPSPSAPGVLLLQIGYAFILDLQLAGGSPLKASPWWSGPCTDLDWGFAPDNGVDASPSGLTS